MEWSLESPGGFDPVLSMLPSVFVLGLAALAAVFLTRNHQSPPENTAERLAAARSLALAVAVQSIHFAEETATGFPERFPAVFGLPSMSLTIFVVFNLICIGFWVASVPGLRSARAAAFFAAWFLAIAGMLNGVAHPFLAMTDGGYFPGLVSSPFMGVAGAWLWLRLREATRPR